MRIHVAGSGWAVGDQVALLPMLRELRRRMPRERLEMVGTKRPDLFLEFSGGTEDSGRELRLVHGGPGRHLVEQFALQAGVDVVDITPGLSLTPEEYSKDFGMNWSRRTVAIDVWANEAARRWPAARFAEVARRLMADGWTVLETGNESIAKRERIPCSRSFLNKLTLRQAAALYSRCSLWIGNDSGGFHLAAAVGTPQVVLFSFVSWTTRAYWHTIPVQAGKSCACSKQPLNGRDCNSATIQKPRCLSEISADRVLEAIELARERWSL